MDAVYPDRVEVAFNQVFMEYRLNARYRKVPFELTKEEFRSLVVSPCHYCGDTPSRERKHRGAIFKFNGIDRIKNELGYVPGNVVPACRTDNFMKGNLSREDFLAAVRRIASHILA